MSIWAQDLYIDRKFIPETFINLYNFLPGPRPGFLLCGVKFLIKFYSVFRIVVINTSGNLKQNHPQIYFGHHSRRNHVISMKPYHQYNRNENKFNLIHIICNIIWVCIM